MIRFEFVLTSLKVEVESLQNHFESIGAINDIEVLKGYAYITFEDSNSAYNAVETLNDTILEGEKIQIELIKENKEDTRGQFRVRVTNLPEGSAWQDFKDFVREKTGMSPAFAKVYRDYDTGQVIGALEFGSEDDLKKAIPLLDKSVFQDVVINAEKDTSLFVLPPRRNYYRYERNGFGRGYRGRGGFGRGYRGRGGFGRGYRGRRFDYERGRYRGGRGGLDRGYRGGHNGFDRNYRGNRGSYEKNDFRDSEKGEYIKDDGYDRDSYIRDRSPTRF